MMNTKFKFSYYNFFIPHKEKDIYIIYNSLANSMIQLEWQTGVSVSNLNDLEIAYLADDVHSLLKDNKMIIPAECNELEQIKLRADHNRKCFVASETLYILLTPTNMCNMNCPYCYQGDKSLENIGEKALNTDNIKALKEYIEKKLSEDENSTIKNIRIDWFGGEPLLYQNIISEFSEYVMNVAEQYKLKYTSSIITNGYLLNAATWQLLNKYKIHHIQITIDGNRESHNQMRSVGRNIGSYDRILNNISLMPNENFTVILRINGDKQIFKAVPQLFDDLAEAHIWPDKANQIRIDWVAKYFSPSGNVQDKEVYFTSYEYHKSKEDFALLMLDRYNKWAIMHNKKTKKLKYSYPTLASFYCTTPENPNAVCVDSKAHVHKCQNTINDIAVKTKHISQFSALDPETNRLNKFEKLSLFGCATCKILPICEENCNKRLMDLDGKKCSSWKYFMNTRMTKIYDQQFSK